MADADERIGLAQREADYDAFVDSNLRRNYTANFIHGMLGMTGFRLMYAPTLIPTYIHMLTGSVAMVGMGQALLQLGAILSPIIGASRIEHRKRILPYAVKTGSMMRLMVLFCAIAGWLLSGWVCAIVTLGLFFLLGIFTGSQRVAFQMLMAKVIPLKRRGRLQAWRNLTGGLIAALLSYYAGSWLIQNNVWGNGYATTFLVTVILTSLGLFGLQLLLREPDPVTSRPAMPLLERVRQFPQLLEDTDYRWFMGAQALTIAARVSAPFYALFAGQQMGLDGKTVGLLSVSFLGADTLSNLAWGNIGDRWGFRITFIGSVVLWALSIMLLLNAQGSVQIMAAFCGLGAASAGYMMSAATMVLEFGAREDIPMRLALSTTVEGTISAIGPIVGGVIAATLGYGPLLWLSVALLVCALMALVLRVKEPRFRVVEPVIEDDLLP